MFFLYKENSLYPLKKKLKSRGNRIYQEGLKPFIVRFQILKSLATICFISISTFIFLGSKLRPLSLYKGIFAFMSPRLQFLPHTHCETAEIPANMFSPFLLSFQAFNSRQPKNQQMPQVKNQ